jgi:sporulation related protein
MLPKQPKFEPGDPASPALLRRRNQLRPAGFEPEPDRDTTLRAIREPQPSLLPEAEPPIDDEPEPDIPPSPGGSTPRAAAPKRVYGESGRRPWLAAIAVAAVVVLGGSSWLLYRALTGRTAPNGDVPYIAADAGPEKVRPQQEGGAQTANQDMRVYNEINGAKPPQEKEVLLPQPEAPMTPPSATGTQPGNLQNQGSAQNQPAAIPSVPAPDLDVAPAAGSSTSPPAADQSTAAGDVAATPTQTAMATGVFRVQLAAVKSTDAAQAAWKKLTKTYPDVLKGLKLEVVKLDRGADGALYRVQAGPFTDRSAAEAACGRLKGKNQGCLVVAP